VNLSYLRLRLHWLQWALQIARSTGRDPKEIECMEAQEDALISAIILRDIQSRDTDFCRPAAGTFDQSIRQGAGERSGATSRN
jgi:hypothetical protein